MLAISFVLIFWHAHVFARGVGFRFEKFDENSPIRRFFKIPFHSNFSKKNLQFFFRLFPRLFGGIPCYFGHFFLVYARHNVFSKSSGKGYPWSSQSVIHHPFILIKMINQLGGTQKFFKNLACVFIYKVPCENYLFLLLEKNIVKSTS